MDDMCFISVPSSFDPEAISSEDVATCLKSLAKFLEPYQEQLQRIEQKGHLQVYVEGLVSGLQRKSIEPIATAHQTSQEAAIKFGCESGGGEGRRGG